MDVNKTQIISNPILGKGLTPTVDSLPGSLLISISQPLLILVEKEALDKVCSYCLSPQPSTSLKRCSGCRIPRYCSTTCQKADWTFIHQKECLLLKNLPAAPPTPVRGMMQMLLKHKHGARPDPEWEVLEGHVQELQKSKGRWEEIVLQSRAAVEFAKREKDWLEMAVYLLCRMSTNAFRATLPDDTPVGLCFSPTLAMANHSCSPNAAIIFDGRKISLRALEKIKAGEQIFISYIDPVQIRDMRKAELKERYFFTCACEVCEGDENVYQVFLRKSKSFQQQDVKSEVWWDDKHLTMEAEKHASAARAQTLSPYTTSQVQDLIQQSRLAPTPSTRLTLLNNALAHLSSLTTHSLYAIPPYPLLLHEIYLHHLSISSYLPALVLLLFISIHCDPYTHPSPYHPLRIHHLFTLATVQKHIASLPTSALLPPETTPFNSDQRQTIRNVDYVSGVQVFLILTLEAAIPLHGRESRFVREMEGELREVEQVQSRRKGGGVGLELRRWMMQGGMAVEGRLLAETVCGDLKGVGGFVGRVLGEGKDGVL